MVVCVAVGCGPSLGGGAESDTEGEGGTDSSSGAATSTPGADADETATFDPSDGSGDDDGTEDDTGGPVEAGLCGVAPDEVVAITMVDDAMHIVHGDTRSFVVDVARTGAPTDANHWYAIAADSDRIAVASNFSVWTGQQHSGSTLRMLESDGSLAWQRDEDGASWGEPILGAGDGVLGRRNPDGGTAQPVLVSGPGREIVLAGFYAFGPRHDDGTFPGRMAQGELFGPGGWMQPETGTFDPVAVPPRDDGLGTWLATWNDALLYRTSTALAIGRPDEVALVELGTSADLQVRDATGDWLLLGDGESNTWARVSLVSRTVESLTLGPPPGLQPFDCYVATPAIDATGAIYVATRDAGAASAYRYDPGGSSWTPVGAPVTATDSMDFTTAGPSALVATTGAGLTFCPPAAFEPAPGVLDGRQLQVVRPDDGVALVLPSDAVAATLDASGACVAYTTPRGTTIVDLPSGDTITVPGNVVHLLR